MISKEGYAGITNYTYNPLNQQVEVFSSEKGIQRNYYDPEGLRAGLEENGAYSRFVFHQREILTEEDGNLALAVRLVRGYGVESCQQNGQSYYYQKDEQFSTLLMTGQEREVENLYQYDAFGVVRGSQEQVRNRITYVGQQYDGVTEQYYLRARYYNPVLGRFLQEDEYRGDGLNLYAYCGNNPVGYYDFSGYAGKNVDPRSLCPEPENPKKDGEESIEGPGYKQTGARNLDNLSIDEIIALDAEAADAYNAIRNSTEDITTISRQTGIPEWKIERIKNHVFNNEHTLRYGKGQFDPDIEISDAWKRLQDGNYTQSDLDLLNHEYYEHRFEEYFQTDYDTAHNRTVESGRTWEP